MGRIQPPILLIVGLIKPAFCNEVPHGSMVFHRSSNVPSLLGNPFDISSKQTYLAHLGITATIAPSMQGVPSAVRISILHLIHELMIDSDDHPRTP